MQTLGVEFQLEDNRAKPHRVSSVTMILLRTAKMKYVEFSDVKLVEETQHNNAVATEGPLRE